MKEHADGGSELMVVEERVSYLTYAHSSTRKYGCMFIMHNISFREELSKLMCCCVPYLHIYDYDTSNDAYQAGAFPASYVQRLVMGGGEGERRESSNQSGSLYLSPLSEGEVECVCVKSYSAHGVKHALLLEKGQIVKATHERTGMDQQT